MRRAVDLFFRGLVRLALGVFFRRIERVGADRLPDSGAVIYVGNHGNSLIDPALALGWLPSGIRMLAKSTLWEQPSTALFVRLAGAVPVYRRMDSGADTSRNRDMFASCFEILGEGGSIALFPEGISHGEPQLQPLKTGAARIALGTAKRSPQTPLAVVPFGLVFDAPQRFRSRVLIEIGRPIDVADYATAAGEDDQKAVRALTARIEDELIDVTLNYSSWEEAEIVRRTADLYANHQGDDRHRGLAGRLPYQRAFAEGYESLKRQQPEEVEAASSEAALYFGALDLLGVTDPQVASEYRARSVLAFLARTLFALLVLLPIGLVGMLLHWIPYTVIKIVVANLPLESELRATYKLMLALILYPATWLATAWIASRFWGQTVALVAAVVAPLSGWIALRLKESWQRLLFETRAYLKLRRQGPVVAELQRQREALIETVDRLVDVWTEAGDQT